MSVEGAFLEQLGEAFVSQSLHKSWRNATSLVSCCAFSCWPSGELPWSAVGPRAIRWSVVVIRHKAEQLYKTTILRIVVVVAVKFKRPNDPPTANLIQLYFVHHRQFEIVPALNTRHVTCCRIDPIRQDTAILFLLNAVTSNKSPPDWPSSLRMGGQLYLKISQRLL